MTNPISFTEVEASLTWERHDWKHYTTGPDGSRWHLVQSTSKKWSIYRNGAEQGDTVTLKDAKFWVADTIFEELRPDIHEKREARRAERRSIRQRRMNS